MNHTVLITGASRGIGLELTKQYAAEQYQVLACARNLEQATQLKDLAADFANISIDKLDVTSSTDIESLAAALAKEKIDILINCAGIFGKRDDMYGNISITDMQQVFNVNTIAPLKVSEAFTKHVANSELKIIVTITSRMGSIEDNTSGGRYAYRASKAAVNMVAKSMAIDLQDQGVKVILLHPGWVQTDMGGPNATTTVADSAMGMRKVIANYNGSEVAPFYSFDGSRIPW